VNFWGVWSWVVFGHNAGYPKSWVKNKMMLMASMKQKQLNPN
jgi:hypothetical protein